jgi:hypothetical protein
MRPFNTFRRANAGTRIAIVGPGHESSGCHVRHGDHFITRMDTLCAAMAHVHAQRGEFAYDKHRARANKPLKHDPANNATLVVLMREGTRTVLSMQNNYQGLAEDFAMVVPVPVVLKSKRVFARQKDGTER